MTISNISRAGAWILSIALVLFLTQTGLSQTGASKAAAAALPKVTKVNIKGLEPLLKPNGKPLLINFWATWCDPCRDEFPDLVKIDAAYKGKIDFITVSLDDVADIATFVPKFLADMKAEMPAYLLSTPDESAAIKMVSKDWAGNLPLTILFDDTGNIAYQRNGKIRYLGLTAEIDKVLAKPEPAGQLYVTIDFVKIKEGRRDEAIFFYENNWKPYREEALKRGVIHSFELLESVPVTTAPFDLILITRYKDQEQHKNSEKDFEPILKEIRPNGAVLKNELKADEFRESVFVYRGRALVGSFK